MIPQISKKALKTHFLFWKKIILPTIIVPLEVFKKHPGDIHYIPMYSTRKKPEKGHYKVLKIGKNSPLFSFQG